MHGGTPVQSRRPGMGQAQMGLRPRECTLHGQSQQENKPTSDTQAQRKVRTSQSPERDKRKRVIGHARLLKISGRSQLDKD